MKSYKRYCRTCGRVFEVEAVAEPNLHRAPLHVRVDVDFVPCWGSYWPTYPTPR